MVIIYCITNKLNGMQYVGQTRQRLSLRLKSHRNRGNFVSYIHRAIMKYGFENFDTKILQRCRTADALSRAERKWIAKLNTRVPSGYNLRDGDEKGRGAWHPESLAKLSAAKKLAGISPKLTVLAAQVNRGRKQPPEQVRKRQLTKLQNGDGQRMSARMRGVGNPRAKLNEHDVAEIREIADFGFGYKAIADAYGMCWRTIPKIVKGLLWRHNFIDAKPLESL